MNKVRTYNKISVKGLEKFSLDKYEIASEIGTPDAIMLRSHVLQPEDIDPSVKAIGRAGAGVNNIPVENCTERGIVVFNAPGANANAVKELALSVAAAWRLSRDVERMENMQSLLSKSDIVTLHLPVLEATRNLINKELVDSFKPGATLINLSREKVADTEAILLGGIASRFPNEILLWDAGKMEFTNFERANPFIRRKYRSGWEIDGL